MKQSINIHLQAILYSLHFHLQRWMSLCRHHKSLAGGVGREKSLYTSIPLIFLNIKALNKHYASRMLHMFTRFDTKIGFKDHELVYSKSFEMNQTTNL
jgi:hypothetical protein